MEGDAAFLCAEGVFILRMVQNGLLSDKGFCGMMEQEDKSICL